MACYNDRVQAFSSDGKLTHKWGGPLAMNILGPFPGWFATVTSIALDSRGNVFVADFYNNRVQKFAPDGTFLTAIGTKGSGPGQFQHAMAGAVAKDGSLFIADFGNNRIHPRPSARRPAVDLRGGGAVAGAAGPQRHGA